MGIYAEKDPRTVGAYRIAEAAHYLDIAPATLRSWVKGRTYPTKYVEIKHFAPLIQLPESDPPLLSFMNLVEAHVLKAIRQKHRIPLYKVRLAIDYLADKLNSSHALAENLKTDDINLFIYHFGTLITLSQHGQLAMREILDAHLQRIKHDIDGLPIELYPFSRANYEEDPKVILINPYISFGRPILRGTGIPTNMLMQRYKAGDSIDTLAEDYGLERLQIEEAIRYELAA
ncbi:DUF433 domain-containing protein [Acidobacteria bacterium AH-259-G07]|nr:DUF433 domain-containing protein [Acidobacteria bacterium AH-259-G07]